ncbi:hypothetical protein PWT90_10570 [Aphanocladium album]|nr:hypothetical protein PWT90_10570 [Aphanocladium album]
MNNHNSNNTFNEYCTGVPSSDGQCLHVAMFYTPQNHPTPGSPLPPIQHTAPPPSYDEAISSAPRTFTTTARPSLPPLSTLLSSMGAAPSSPPPPYSPLPTTPAPRFPVYYARYVGSADDKDDTSRDHHKLFILTSLADEEGRERGIYIHLTGTRRRGLRVEEKMGDAPERNKALRECTLLGHVSGDDLDALQSICREVHTDRLPATGGSRSQGRRKPVLSVSCRFVQYTLSAPPPPYNSDDVMAPEPLTSPSQEWVAAVIDLAESRGVLQRY